MVEFKLNISNKGKSYSKQVSGDEADVFKGKKLGDKIPGDGFGLTDYELEISGGSDKSGFPIRKDVEGMTRRRILIIKGVGLRRSKKGLRRKRTVSGNMLSDRIAQINLNVVKEGKRNLEEIFGKKEKEVKEEVKEEKKEEKKDKQEKKEKVEEKVHGEEVKGK